MKNLLKIALLTALSGVAGCGKSVPECGDSDVKKLVIKIVEENKSTDTLRAINNNIQRYKERILQLKENRKTEIANADMEQWKFEVEKWDVKLKSAAEPIAKLNLLIGLPANNLNWEHGFDGFRHTASRYGWKELGVNGRVDAVREFEHNLRRLVDFDSHRKWHVDYLLKVNPLVGLPADNRDIEKFRTAVQAQPEDPGFWRDIGNKSRRTIHNRSNAIKEFETSLGYIGGYMKQYRPQHALAKMQKYNEYVGLPANNRDTDKFEEVAKSHGWQDTNYGNFEDAVRDFASLVKEYREIAQSHATAVRNQQWAVDKKRRIEGRNAEIDESIIAAHKGIEGWQAAVDYIKNGVFSAKAIRTTAINETTGKQQCAAQLQFKHPSKTHITDIKYTVELTTDDEIYVEIYNLQDVYDL